MAAGQKLIDRPFGVDGRWSSETSVTLLGRHSGGTTRAMEFGRIAG